MRSWRGVDQGADRGAPHSLADVARGQQVEHDDRHVVVHAQAERGGIGHLQALFQDLAVGDLGEHRRVGKHPRIGVEHAVDGLGHQHDLGADLESSLCGGGVGGEVRHADTGAEDHHPALFQVPFGAARNVGLGDLPHGDGGLHPGVDVVLALEEVLQRQTVHHGAEHAHVVGTCPVHPAFVQFGAAEEVATADDDGDLHAVGGDLGDLVGDGGDDIGVDPDLTAAEHLAAELQHNPPKRAPWVDVCHANSASGHASPRETQRSDRAGGANASIMPTRPVAALRFVPVEPEQKRAPGSVDPGARSDQAVPTSKRLNAVTLTPAWASNAPTVFFESNTDDCSTSTASL